MCNGAGQHGTTARCTADIRDSDGTITLLGRRVQSLTSLTLRQCCRRERPVARSESLEARESERSSYRGMRSVRR